MIPTPNFHLILLAAGSGMRMGTSVPKAFLKAAGKSLLAHCTGKFATFKSLKNMVIVLPSNMTLAETDVVSDPRMHVCSGGHWRSQSVYQGLLILEKLNIAATDWVLVHDCARALTAVSDIHNLLITLREHLVGGILATPVSDTLKRCDTNKNILETLSRAHLWQAQTPQMFRFHLLLKVLSEIYTAPNFHKIENFADITDEAYLVETYLQLTPQIVAAKRPNIKITYPEDLALFESMIYFLENAIR